MLNIKVPTRLDAVNSPEFEKQILSDIEKEKPGSVVCDFSDTVYISSAGLRVMLVISKEMAKTGADFTLHGMNNDVYAIFKMAGFQTIMNIER